MTADDANPHSGRQRDRSAPTLTRRPFLSAVGILGCSTTVTKATTGAPSAGSWDPVDDPYYASLVDEFQGLGLPPGEFVYADTEAETLAAYGHHGAGAIEPLGIGDDLPFSQAIRITVPTTVRNPWDALLKGTVRHRSVAAGDVLLGIVYLRDGAPDDGTVPVVRYAAKVQDREETNLVQNATQPSLSGTWERYNFRIRMDEPAAAGSWWTELFLGFGEQTVDVGGLALVHFGDGVSLGDLPTWTQEYDYPGRNADAAWRDTARRRIEQYRMAPLTVTVRDGRGNPIEGATVDVTMQAHAFGFGSAVAAPRIVGGGTDNERYRETFLENFNKAVTENVLKYGAWSGQWGPAYSAEIADETVDWLVGHDIPIRGHPLVWATYERMGVDPTSPEAAIRATIRDRIEERATAMRGRLDEWDMHNHPIMFPEIWEDLGKELMLEWWETANEADPEAVMYINEDDILSGGGRLKEPYYDLIEWLVSQEADVEGIGFMGHFALEDVRSPTTLLEVFDKFTAFDLPLQITEFDISISDPDDEEQVAARADFLADVYTAAFSHPAVEGVLAWGFWADAHWRPDSAYYGSDWTLRPHGKRYRELVFEEWWTDESGTTDTDGQFELHGFKGIYEIAASAASESETAKVQLGDAGHHVEITLAGVENDDGQPGFGPVATAGGMLGVIKFLLHRYDRTGDD